MKNILLVIETVMSIPISNNFVESVFSHLTRIWTDVRNHMNIDLIKAEICIKNNFDMNCLDFKNYIKSNQKVLKSVKSQEKYDFKNN